MRLSDLQPDLRRDSAARWAMILALAGIAMAGLAARDVRLDLASALPKAQVSGLLLVGAAVYGGLGARFAPLRRPARILEDYFLSLLQLLAAMTVMLPLTYLATGVGFPLQDAALARLDALIGFEWHAAAQWVAARPWLDWTLQQAYFSLVAQGAAALMICSIARPGDRNGEAIWLFLVSLLITTVISVFVPAIGMIGHVGMGYVELVTQIRDGSWAVMSFGKAEGIITFPSFHTTLAIILTWVVRHNLWALAVFAPLNALMILATPTVGGHYLVDLFGGAVVAAVSIPLVNRLRARIARGARHAHAQPALSAA